MVGMPRGRAEAANLSVARASLATWIPVGLGAVLLVAGEIGSVLWTLGVVTWAAGLLGQFGLAGIAISRKLRRDRFPQRKPDEASDASALPRTQVRTKRLKRVDVITVSGRLDGGSASRLQEVLEASLNSGRYRLVVDVSGVDPISSAGLEVLVAARDRARRSNGGDLILVGASPGIRRALELAGLDGIFETFETPADAVNRF